MIQLDDYNHVRQAQWQKAADAQPLIVIQGCDLLSQPAERPLVDPMDKHRLSQLLPGEGVTLVQESKEWVQVSAAYQPRWDEDSKEFKPYQGWVLKNILHNRPQHPYWIVSSHQAVIRSQPSFDSPAIIRPPMGSFVYSAQQNMGWHSVKYGSIEGWIFDKDVACPGWLDGCQEQAWRWQILESAMRLKGAGYVWGGLGLPCAGANIQVGIDCSGLVHLIARRLGRLIPRDAKDQYRWLEKMTNDALKPADLVFFSSDSPSSINHVLIVDEEEQTIESARLKQGFYQSNLHERLQLHGPPLKQGYSSASSRDGTKFFFARLWSLQHFGNDDL